VRGLEDKRNRFTGRGGYRLKCWPWAFLMPDPDMDDRRPVKPLIMSESDGDDGYRTRKVVIKIRNALALRTCQRSRA
jgi:hypothetical protein